MDYKEFEGKNVDEAIVLAMKGFRSSLEALDIQVVSEGAKGFLGFVGNKNARILARPFADGADEDKGEDASEYGTQPFVEKTDPEDSLDDKRQQTDNNDNNHSIVDPEVMEQARTVLATLLGHMNIPAQIDILDNGVLDIEGDGSGLIIGKRGQTLDALQDIVNRIVNRTQKGTVYITLDTEGYRERHLSHLESIASQMGQKAKDTGRNVSLERMTPHDRRIIHLALRDDPDLNTKSVGSGSYKKVVIYPKKG